MRYGWVLCKQSDSYWEEAVFSPVSFAWEAAVACPRAVATLKGKQSMVGVRVVLYDVACFSKAPLLVC